MRKVYVENGDYLISKMFVNNGWNLASKLEGADLLCLEGGADVTPALYGEENVSSRNSPMTDIESLGLIMFASLSGIPIVGICRGSQILCVAQGGKLKQHIDGHSGSHNLTVDGVDYRVSSTHHQESIPNMWAPVNNIYRADDGTVEMVLYPSFTAIDDTTQPPALGCQFHPEYFKTGDECIKLFFDTIERHLFGV